MTKVLIQQTLDLNTSWFEAYQSDLTLHINDSAHLFISGRSPVGLFIMFTICVDKNTECEYILYLSIH